MILLNNQFVERDEVKIDIEDRGYQFGDGVYEVIRVYNGSCFRMDEHIKRLERSLAGLCITLDYTSDALRDRLTRLVSKNGIKDGIIYLQVTRGVATRVHHFPDRITPVLFAYVKEVDNRPVIQMRDGVHTILTEDIRWKNCYIKSINLLGNVISKQLAKESGCAEAIMHCDSVVTEGSSTNVFAIKDKKIYTHPANRSILNGITRAEVLKIAHANGVEVIETACTTNELLNADEVIITSTTMEITPVVKIDETVIGNGEPGPITRMLQESFVGQIPL